MFDHAPGIDVTDDVPADDDRGGVSLLQWGSLATVLASVLVSALSYGPLPNSVRIHWTLGAGEYYGPEFAPTVLVLGLFPVAVGLGALLGWGLAATLSDVEGFETVRPLYTATVLAVLAVLVSTQAIVVWANL